MWWPRERGGMDLRYRSLFDNRGILRLVRTGLRRGCRSPRTGSGCSLRSRERCGSRRRGRNGGRLHRGPLCWSADVGRWAHLAMISGPTMKEASLSALPSQSAPVARCSDHRSGAGVGHRPPVSRMPVACCSSRPEPHHRRGRVGSPDRPDRCLRTAGVDLRLVPGLPLTTWAGAGQRGPGVAAEHLGAAGSTARRGRGCARPVPSERPERLPRTGRDPRLLVWSSSHRCWNVNVRSRPWRRRS